MIYIFIGKYRTLCLQKKDMHLAKPQNFYVFVEKTFEVDSFELIFTE